MKVDFTPIDGVNYSFDYIQLFSDIANGVIQDPTSIYRKLCREDSFFLLYFVLHYTTANHPFVVEACKELDRSGEEDWVIDLWARGHFKSSTITVVGTIKRLLNNPEERVGILSHTRPAAKGFLINIKQILATNAFLKQYFPDILYEKPESEAPRWSDDGGLCVKRVGYYNEASIEAWGLVEGMPTGKHFTYRIYDDIETKDLVANPDMITKLKDSFEISQNLKSLGGKHRIVGTPYSHLGLLEDLRKRKNPDGSFVYKTRVKPATHDGTIYGHPVLLSQQELDALKCDEGAFNSQQLLNPSPVGVRRFNSSMLQLIHPELIPLNIVKFVIVDSAGDKKQGKGDSWACLCMGVEPNLDNLGLSNVYITDGKIEPLDEAEAPFHIVHMWEKNQPVESIAIEKVGLSTTETHVANAAATKGYFLSLNNGTIKLLTPKGRNKQFRIASALATPFKQSKIFIASHLKDIYERLCSELDQFPYWHDDGLDALSYLYDLFSDQTICWLPAEPEDEPLSYNQLVGAAGRNVITGY